MKTKTHPHFSCDPFDPTIHFCPVLLRKFFSEFTMRRIREFLQVGDAEELFLLVFIEWRNFVVIINI